MSDRLTAGLNLFGNALALRAERQRVIASNIANADTPGYAARDFDFAQALDTARGAQRTGMTAATGGASALALQATHAGHLGLAAGAGMGDGAPAPRLLYDTPAQPSLDGNSVDLDRERARFADNAIRYEATLRFVNGHVKTLLSAIQGQ